MKWGQRFDNDDEVPEELRGKSPTEVAAALKAAGTAATKAQEAEAARIAAETAKTAAETEAQQMRERITALEANQRPPDPPSTNEPPTVWTDPDAFIDKKMEGVTAVALQSGMMTAKMYCLNNLSQRDAKIFKKYEKKIDEVVATFAPAARVMPQSWFNALLFVKGQNDLEISKFEADKTDFFSETPSRGQTPEPEPTDRLTAEEEEICKKFHYDPKSYLDRKKTAALSQSSKGAYARYPVPTTTK